MPAAEQREVAMSFARLLLPVAAALLIATAASPARTEVLIGDVSPLTGPLSWIGAHYLAGTELAVADLNAKGGVLGEQVRLVSVDDACDTEQAGAAARKLISDGIVFVVGHVCSGAAIAAAPLYEGAAVIMMSASATNPRLTEEGRANVFRVVGRDDQQGIIGGDYLAEHWGHKKIAILHDGQPYGAGIAAETRKQLRKRGIDEILYEQITPGQVDYSDVVSRLAAAGIDVVYYGGYVPEVGLLIRQARARDYGVQLVSADGLSSEDFWLIAGTAAEGTLFTSFRDPSREPGAAAILERARVRQIEPNSRILYSYGAVQAWAAAVAKAGSLDLEEVTAALRRHEFETVLGRIRFDNKGDVIPAGFEWFVWTDGAFVPKDLSD
jgi:branched-chain amino acid transport system substrate-binding protein